MSVSILSLTNAISINSVHNHVPFQLSDGIATELNIERNNGMYLCDPFTVRSVIITLGLF